VRDVKHSAKAGSAAVPYTSRPNISGRLVSLTPTLRFSIAYGQPVDGRASSSTCTGSRDA